jgi:hypothetical protein
VLVQVNQKGGGQEMQLPDIITKQQGLVDKIKGLDKGKSPGGEKNVGILVGRQVMLAKVMPKTLWISIRSKSAA